MATIPTTYRLLRCSCSLFRPHLPAAEGVTGVMSNLSAIPIDLPPPASKPQFDWPIWVLIAALLVSGFGLASVAGGEPSVVAALFVAVLFCQSSLLGLWVAFGRSHFVLRIVVLLALMGLLTAELGWVAGLEGPTIFLVSLPTLLVGGVAWLIRIFRASVVQIGTTASTIKEGLQFSIRDLFWLTFVVACLLTIGKLLWPHFQFAGLIIVIPVIGIGFTAVGLTSSWSILGSGNPFLRSVVVLVIAGISGGIIGSLIGHGFIIFWTFAMFLHAVFLIGSLLVVRRCGYRLMKKSAAG